MDGKSRMKDSLQQSKRPVGAGWMGEWMDRWRRQLFKGLLKAIKNYGGWLDGWMDGCKSRFKDCLQQLKMSLYKLQQDAGAGQLNQESVCLQIH